MLSTWIAIAATIIQGCCLYWMRRTLYDIIRLRRAPWSPLCTCYDDDILSSAGKTAPRLTCPIHERHGALPPAREDYRHAPCPACGQLIQPRSAP